MTEDLDKDLEGLAGDLDDLDLGDATGDTETAAAAEEGGGGEDVELDDDLQAMLNESGGDEPAEPPGEGGDEDLGGALGDELGDALGDELGDALGGEPGAEAGGAAGGGASGGGARPSAPAPTPPPPPITANLDESQVVNLEFLLDIKLHVTFEVGRSKMLISDLLTLGQGSVIELHRLVGDELDLLVNGKLVAKGEVVVVNEKFGCKITDIIPPEERVKHLGAV